MVRPALCTHSGFAGEILLIFLITFKVNWELTNEDPRGPAAASACFRLRASRERVSSAAFEVPPFVCSDYDDLGLTLSISYSHDISSLVLLDGSHCAV